MSTVLPERTGPVKFPGGSYWMPNTGGSVPFWFSADGLTYSSGGAFTSFPNRTSGSFIDFGGNVFWNEFSSSAASKNYLSSDGVAVTQLDRSGAYPDITAGYVANKISYITNLGILYILSSQAGAVYVYRTADGAAFTKTLTNLPLLSGAVTWKLLTLSGVFFALPDTDFPYDTNSTKSVYSSSDGVTWSLVTSAWGVPNCSYGAAVFSGRIYVCGGIGPGVSYLNSVYSSADGISWVLESYSAIWSVRISPNIQNFNNQLSLFGGSGPVFPFPLFDVWSVLDPNHITRSPL